MKTNEFLATHPVFSLREAAEILGVSSGQSGTVERLKHYLETKQLKLVTRGIYAVVPPGLRLDQFQPDSFLVAKAVREDSLFSHHSALELLGAAHSMWNQCTVYTGKRRKSLRSNGANILFLDYPHSLKKDGDKNFATQKIERRGKLLDVTSPERTLVEGFRRPNFAGGLEELVRSAAGFPVLDLDLLEEVLRRYDMAYLWASVGWFLEKFKKSFHVPDEVIFRMEQRRPRSPQYLDRGSRGGLLAPRWGLILPKSLFNLGEPDESQPRVLVVGLEELWIGKLLALLNRCAAKDVWDTANSKGIAAEVVKSGLFRARFLAMAAVLDHPLPSYGRSRFERLLTDRIVVEQLGPMLAQGRIPSANELIERSWTIVHPFLNLDAREEEYFKAIYRGELKAEYLFPGTPDEAAKFNGHPAILWKVANVRKNLKRTNR